MSRWTLIEGFFRGLIGGLLLAMTWRYWILAVLGLGMATYLMMPVAVDAD